MVFDLQEELSKLNNKLLIIFHLGLMMQEMGTMSPSKA
jgi:hypothetical protein